MPSFPKITALALLVATAGVQARPSTTNVTTFGKNNWARIEAWSGDDCQGEPRGIEKEDRGDYKCLVPRGTVRSLHMTGHDCVVYTHSGVDCYGTWAVVDFDMCTTVLYGSISVACYPSGE